MLSFSTPKEQTDQQFNDSVKARTDARAKVIASRTAATENVKNWTIAKIPQAKTDAYIKYVNDEIAWWNANPVLTTRQVTERYTHYNDMLQQKKEELNTFAAQNISQDTDPADQEKLIHLLSPADQARIRKEIADKKAQDDLLARQEQERIENYGWYDAFWDAFADALKWISTIAYIIIALRFAAFAANDYLYMPAPYRILKFIYTFIFMPIFFPFYVWREIKSYIWKGEERPRFEAVFIPLFSYIPDADPVKNPPTFLQKFFGYRDIQEINDWIHEMQNKQNEERLSKIKNTAEIREAFIKEKSTDNKTWVAKEPIAAPASAPAPAPPAPAPPAPVAAARAPPSATLPDHLLTHLPNGRTIPHYGVPPAANAPGHNLWSVYDRTH